MTLTSGSCDLLVWGNKLVLGQYLCIGCCACKRHYGVGGIVIILSFIVLVFMFKSGA